ncbi:hypothetical protein FNL37_1813 [Methylovorus glucosotrophus]|uniref:hypothetical protein n=1 Tax=Methylovorus glucosotrophus TaxID=266009 RepID=UPI0013317F9A|nr:hypothetical protein [Methylovorus glucosotrophus]KAF0844369.1 hypothetical protein FNL37_1813 [Methylovorus glucosotrophus]
MITEQRLRFEAKHKVPDGVVWSEKLNCYTKTFPSSRNDSWVAIQNALWQGYQSALEDRQGEAVVWPNGCDETVPQALRYLAEHERPAGGNDSFNSEHLHQLADEIEEMAGKPLFTSPQPAQPDQWNAAIEAAADTAHDAIHEAIYKIDDCVPVKAAVVAAILALRKGA